MRIKICGLPSIDVAKKILELKPDAIGIYCWQEEEKGANFVSPQVAQEIALLAKDHSVQTFYLTYALTAIDVVQEWQQVQSTHVQLLGDISTEELITLKQILPSLSIVKVIGVTDLQSSTEAATYADCPAVDELLLDSRSGSIRGGTGKTHDWNISRNIIQNTKKPVWLAGGLRVNNVVEAIQTANPYGIDLETGIQNPDRSKNYELAQNIITMVHAQ